MQCQKKSRNAKQNKDARLNQAGVHVAAIKKTGFSHCQSKNKKSSSMIMTSNSSYGTKDLGPC